MKAPQLLLFQEKREEAGSGSTFHRFIGRWVVDGVEYGTSYDVSFEEGERIGTLLDATGFQFVVTDYVNWLNERSSKQLPRGEG